MVVEIQGHWCSDEFLSWVFSHVGLLSEEIVLFVYTLFDNKGETVS